MPCDKGENDCKICGSDGSEAEDSSVSRSGDARMQMCGLSDVGSARDMAAPISVEKAKEGYLTRQTQLKQRWEARKSMFTLSAPVYIVFTRVRWEYSTCYKV